MAVLIGQVMLAAGAVIFVVSGLAVIPRLVRVRRRALALQTAVFAARKDALTALALLEAQRAETRALLAQWRPLLRWARHPLVAATLDWYRRRAQRRAHE